MSLHLSKCYIVGNDMSRLICVCRVFLWRIFLSVYFCVFVFKNHVHAIKEYFDNKIDGYIHSMFEPTHEFETYHTDDQQCLS